MKRHFAKDVIRPPGKCLFAGKSTALHPLKKIEKILRQKEKQVKYIKNRKRGRTQILKSVHKISSNKLTQTAGYKMSD
jgi:hypothetical protein